MINLRLILKLPRKNVDLKAELRKLFTKLKDVDHLPARVRRTERRLCRHVTVYRHQGNPGRYIKGMHVHD
jgi:hypothetical protein